ncbi:MAG: hypothetical protein J7M13_09040 [Synergistetes bacterium]|nr:hypothetical protein [Synergistota bacterium]
MKRLLSALVILFLLLILALSAFASSVNLTADKVLFYPEDNLMKAFGNVRLVWRDKRALADKGWVNFKNNDASLEGNVIIEDERGRVRADRVSFISKLQLVRAEGNVLLITKKGIKLRCGRLEAYEDGTFKADDNPFIEGKRFTLKAREIILKGERAEISSPVYMGDDGKLALSAERAKLTFLRDGKLERVDVSGKVLLIHRKGSTSVRVKGEKGTYDLIKGKVRVSGNAVAFKGKTEIRADEIIYNVKTGVMKALGRTKMIIH